MLVDLATRGYWWKQLYAVMCGPFLSSIWNDTCAKHWRQLRSSSNFDYNYNLSSHGSKHASVDLKKKKKTWLELYVACQVSPSIQSQKRRFEYMI